MDLSGWGGVDGGTKMQRRKVGGSKSKGFNSKYKKNKLCK